MSYMSPNGSTKFQGGYDSQIICQPEQLWKIVKLDL